jgi:hypothetical protein
MRTRDIDCRCHKCEKPISENYYCDECASYLNQYKQKQKEKPKEKKAKAIHDFMFG